MPLLLEHLTMNVGQTLLLQKPIMMELNSMLDYPLQLLFVFILWELVHVTLHKELYLDMPLILISLIHQRLLMEIALQLAHQLVTDFAGVLLQPQLCQVIVTTTKETLNVNVTTRIHMLEQLMEHVSYSALMLGYQMSVGEMMEP
jgi:hypothetical protein